MQGIQRVLFIQRCCDGITEILPQDLSIGILNRFFRKYKIKSITLTRSPLQRNQRFNWVKSGKKPIKTGGLYPVREGSTR